MIAGVFGVAWTAWAMSGFSGATALAVRVAGLAVGLAILVLSARQWRSAASANRSGSTHPVRTGSRSMFASPAFWLVTIIEGVAIRGATALLDATGYLDYVIACTAVVVGVHFLAMGRLFWVGAYGLGAALIAAGLAGASVGLGGGDAAAIKATTGLLAGASLFAAGGFGVVYSRRVTRRGASRQRRA